LISKRDHESPSPRSLNNKTRYLCKIPGCYPNSKQSYKPGSVPSFPKVVIICLGPRLPGASSNLPGGEAGSFNASLFGLAPGGVYLAGQSPDRRCALTAPLHPYPAPLGGFHFCGTIPWGHPHWVLPSTLPCGARTFLTHRLSNLVRAITQTACLSLFNSLMA
jgi:hypothetical protein